jgi:hypothetical protein
MPTLLVALAPNPRCKRPFTVALALIKAMVIILLPFNTRVAKTPTTITMLAPDTK